jgi:arabinan endo-1,5-alpha-L-arabinosidase
MADLFANPLPGPTLGDPFVLRWRGRFYLFGTNDGPPLPSGRAVPIYRSDDLVRWEPLGGALEPIAPAADHWAPEVLAWNGRFYMVVSFGDVEHVGHALWAAIADEPAGPYRLAKRLSDPSEPFSIDGAWLLDDDGRLYLYRCLDFVEDEAPPHGTGIVVQPMSDPLTPAGPPETVLRAHAPWHLFEADRAMPLHGGRTFAAWTTIEGPAPVRRAGRVFCGYSGGNYRHAYGTGEAVADAPMGPYIDLRGREGPIFGTTPGLVEGPGHFSVVRPDGLHDWIVLHGRSPGEGVRRVWLCPASWGPEGVAIGALTDRPQPPPPLPTDLTRFAGLGGPVPDGWRPSGRGEGDGRWSLDGEGLRADPGPAPAIAWREGLALGYEWVAEVYLRFAEAPGGPAGLVVASKAGHELRVLVAPPARWEASWPRGAGGGRPSAGGALPTLGDPFDPKVFHVLVIRARGGRAEARLDGVRLADDLPVPDGPARLGLVSSGVATFDAIAITLA